MRVLITGATGFVGRTLDPYLYNYGIGDIVLLVRDVSKSQKIFSEINCKIISTEQNDWRGKVIDCSPDVVLHMATCFIGKSDRKSVIDIIDTNILFSTLLLETLSVTGCKYFINIGTYSEYSFGAGEYSPNNLYSASKTAFRPIIQYYQSISKWKWINVIIYSPYGRKNCNKKVIDYMIDALTATQPVAFTYGEQILDFIHVDDIANFFSTLITRLSFLPMSYYEFHLGTGKGYSIREVAKIIERIWKKRINADWGKRAYSSSDIMYAVAPISKNIDLLNWKAQIDIEEGLTILYHDVYK